MSAQEQPFYIHDCTRCNFLGRYVAPEGIKYDLYHHGSEFETTVIARFSSDGPDYTSGLCFAISAELDGRHDHPLYVAMKRAEEQGFMPLTVRYLGVSEAYQKHLCKVFRESEYVQGLPDIDTYLSSGLPDDQYDAASEAYADAIDVYNAAWKAKHGTVPKAPHVMAFLFETQAEAEKWCKPGRWEAVQANSDEHARELLCDFERRTAAVRSVERLRNSV